MKWAGWACAGALLLLSAGLAVSVSAVKGALDEERATRYACETREHDRVLGSARRANEDAKQILRSLDAGP